MLLLLNSSNNPSPNVLHQVRSTDPKDKVGRSVNISENRQLGARSTSKERQLGARSSVRFGGISEVWYSSSNSCSSFDHDTDGDDDFSLWYTAEDFDRFKEVFVADAKHALQRERLQGSKSTKTNETRSVRRAYDVIMASCLSSSSSSSSFSATQDGHHSLEASLQELNLPLHDEQVEETVLGLERLMARNIHRDKVKRRHLLLNVVEEIQVNGQDLSSELQTAMLRRVCESISNPAKKFALYLGMSASSSTSTSNMICS